MFLRSKHLEARYHVSRSTIWKWEREGVLPPAATGITKYQKTSFGGTGLSSTQFRSPSGVAYFDKILYVADAGNSRILRFKLTTDFE